MRQLAVSARKHVGEREPKFETTDEQQERLAARFFDAFQEGNLEALESLLADDVVLRGDGGGKVPALGRPIRGRLTVARQLRTFRKTAARLGIVDIRRTEVNGQPGALTLDAEGKLVNVVTLDIAGGQIRGVNGVSNPDKLRHLGPLSDIPSSFEWSQLGS